MLEAAVVEMVDLEGGHQQPRKKVVVVMLETQA
jgi:hypothetical protein